MARKSALSFGGFQILLSAMIQLCLWMLSDIKTARERREGGGPMFPHESFHRRNTGTKNQKSTGHTPLPFLESGKAPGSSMPWKLVSDVWSRLLAAWLEESLWLETCRESEPFWPFSQELEKLHGGCLQEGDQKRPHSQYL